MKSEGRFADSIRQLGLRVEKRRPEVRWLPVGSRFQAFSGSTDRYRTFAQYLPGDPCHIAAKIANVPIVINTRSWSTSCHGWKSSLQYRWACKYIDRVVAVSQDAARLTIDKDRIRKDRVEFLWNGIDLNAFPFRGGCSESTIISVGRLVPRRTSKRFYKLPPSPSIGCQTFDW